MYIKCYYDFQMFYFKILAQYNSSVLLQVKNPASIFEQIMVNRFKMSFTLTF